MMTEYTVMHVLRFHREMPLYQEAQANREWLRRPIVRPEQRRIGFLGLGLMAKAPALVLKSLGFPVSAWVRSPREDEEIPIFHGADQFERFMSQTDIAVCLLAADPRDRGHPVRPHLRDDAARARWSSISGAASTSSTADLIAALDSGQLSYAALDALHPEPLPPESPLWLHPKVTVMPHVARRPTVRQLVTEIAANISSIEAGGGLLQEIDKTDGVLGRPARVTAAARPKRRLPRHRYPAPDRRAECSAAPRCRSRPVPGWRQAPRHCEPAFRSRRGSRPQSHLRP